MARIDSISRTVRVDQPQLITLTDEERKTERLRVGVVIVNRPPSVGVWDAEKLIPRKWSGYAYLIRQNWMKRAIPIEWDNTILYDERILWAFEQVINTYSIESTTPDSDPNELLDETAVLNYYSDSTDPLNYYFPFPHDIDSVGVWFPLGVILDVVIEAWKWSPVSVAGEDNDLPVEDYIVEQLTVAAPPVNTATEDSVIDACKTILDLDEGEALCSSFYDLGRVHTVNQYLIINRSPGFPSTATPYVGYHVGSTFLLAKSNNPPTITVTSTGRVTSYFTLSDAINDVNGTDDTNNSQQWGCGYIREQGSASQ